MNVPKPLVKKQKEDGTSSTSSAERKRRRKTRSLERRRQRNELELSDSDEDVPPAPISNGISQAVDEVDQCPAEPTEVEETVVITTETELKLPLVIDDSLLRDKDEPIYNEILKIDETESDTQNVVVDVHATDLPTTCEVLEIVEGDRDRRATSPNREYSIRTKLTKERELEDVPENEKENEIDASELEADKDSKIKAVDDKKCSSDDCKAAEIEVICTEPLDLCDKNQSVTYVNSDIAAPTNPSGKLTIEQDVNHNDVIVVETTTASVAPVINEKSDKNNNYCEKNQNEILEDFSECELATGGHRRISDSSVSSFNESDGLDTEPAYAKVDKKKKPVSLSIEIWFFYKNS